MSASVSLADDAFQRSSSAAPPKTKKRKSWGQVLPKPTTNLPPRKRAKTEEEKAQRKYERVQRNRHAAHMSRMRKQDEMEQLKHQNDVLKQDNSSLNMEISRLQEELNMLRQGSNVSAPRQSTSPSNVVIASLEAPSLPASLSPSAPSIDHDSIATPPPLPAASFPLQVSKPDASHSAVMCSQQWTSGLLDFPTTGMIKQEHFMPM